MALKNIPAGPDNLAANLIRAAGWALNILIAEDDRISRLLLRETLTHLGHSVVAMNDGSAAKTALSQTYFPLVISDWIMPGCDGLELCRFVRSAPWERYTYVMLLTSVGGRENFLAAMDAGIDDFIAKPLDRDQLAARIRVAERILNLQTAVRQLEGLIPICSYCKNVRGLSQEVCNRPQAAAL